MRYSVLMPACAVALVLSGAAIAQTTTTTKTTTVTTLSPTERAEVREYIVKEHRTSTKLSDFDVAAGAVLPSTVEVYSVPKFDRYRYTVVNEHRVLIDPTTRRVVEVIE